MVRFLLPPPEKYGSGGLFSDYPRMISALRAGTICAVGSLLLNLAARMIYIKGWAKNLELIGFIIPHSGEDILKYLIAITVVPIVETFLFLWLWVLKEKYLTKFRSNDFMFLLIMAFLGWALHGANSMSISRAFGFFVLAAVFLGWARRDSLKSAFWTTALAHSIWNGVALCLIAMLGLLRDKI